MPMIDFADSVVYYITNNDHMSPEELTKSLPDIITQYYVDCVGEIVDFIADEVPRKTFTNPQFQELLWNAMVEKLGFDGTRSFSTAEKNSQTVKCSQKKSTPSENAKSSDYNNIGNALENEISEFLRLMTGNTTSPSTAEKSGATIKCSSNKSKQANPAKSNSEFENIIADFLSDI